MTAITKLRLAIMTHWDGDQYELAARCQIDPSDLSKYALGLRRIRNDHRAILAHVLGVTPVEIDGRLDGPILWDRATG